MADPRKFTVNRADRDVADFGDPKPRVAHVNVKIFDRVPGANEIGEGEHVYSVVAGVRKMHVKLQGVVVATTLT